MNIVNQITAIYNGVNQQSASQRLETQVEEMINVVPTLNQETVKRNPTEKIELSSAINFSDETYQYSYDRGDVELEDENYSIQITSTGIDIIDVVNGNVFTDGSGLTYDGTSKNYITSSFGGRNGFSCITIKDTTFIVNKTVNPQMMSYTFPTTTSDKNAFFWIKSANASYGYTYTYSLTNSNGTITANITDTNTADVAQAVATSINGKGLGFSATRVGSVVKVTSTSTITSCTMTDTYGSQASRGFIDEVSTISDLPATLGYEGTVIKIIGTAGTKVPYYVIYSGGNWKETISGSVVYKINTSTMPHILVRESNGTFTFKEYDGWSDRTIGDDDVTPLPSIFKDDNVIKDICFLKNRLCFLTETTFVLSEVANYGNFFRTTALSYLDSDPIDITINTTKAILFEYAVNMEDSLMITSDKLQFRLKTVDVLTYETIEFIPTSAYEINRNVRPLFMNNRVFFVVGRGNYSAVMEFYISTTTNTIAGDDITAHCQFYIDGNIDKLSGSPVNNMLFLSKTGSDTIYCYKYYDNGQQRVQSAWFKWTFNGSLYNQFVIGKKLFLLINRKDASVQDEWLIATGVWNDDEVWCDGCYWVDNAEDITTVNQVEKMDIFPQEHTETFLDNGDTVILSDILIGEWVVSSGGTKDISTRVNFLTAKIDSEDGSDFKLYILDNNRNTRREVSSKYTVGRKPFVGGDTKNIKIGIESRTENGFRIGSIAFEGRANSRSKRI